MIYEHSGLSFNENIALFNDGYEEEEIEPEPQEQEAIVNNDTNDVSKESVKPPEVRADTSSPVSI